MIRGPDPRRLYDAKRTGVRDGIRDKVMISEARADLWVRVWEMEAESRGLDRDSREYWPTGLAWILEQLAKGL